ncbi:hypothetical protein [Roseinatronobacter alkalisoli]|uniref:Uncharacterized protein n=1 Tax=Roseinatronobacter alkalisoli TaxID=3028235 RepID=A0ABT5T8X0_9RHOB|nr:hypothetical protein [Roseinatronobacter sp. HJB301]MDD7971436.1 hypothetical protein [Roseinatronobacter sp. HJB301]
MTRHLIDTPRQGADTSRLARFIRIARMRGLHQAKDALSRRAPLRSMTRLTVYSRIARGKVV